MKLGPEALEYILERSDRRTLAISVHPDGTVVVTAPLTVKIEEIEARLRRRGAWLLKTRREFERLRPRTPDRRYLAGETHRFLGRQYLLLLDSAAPRGVTLSHDHITIGGAEAAEPSRIRTRLGLWRQREARRVFSERLRALAPYAGVDGPKIRLVVRPLEKRWGSLSASGRTLILNRRLIEADLDCIDFVIVHELCHLKHRHHGPAFKELLYNRMPDWKARKVRLEAWTV